VASHGGLWLFTGVSWSATTVFAFYGSFHEFSWVLMEVDGGVGGGLWQ